MKIDCEAMYGGKISPSQTYINRRQTIDSRISTVSSATTATRTSHESIPRQHPTTTAPTLSITTATAATTTDTMNDNDNGGGDAPTRRLMEICDALSEESKKCVQKRNDDYLWSDVIRNAAEKELVELKAKIFQLILFLLHHSP
jgi:hypothetical protein